MSVTRQVSLLIAGTFAWIAVTALVSGLIPASRMSDVGFMAAMTFGLAAAALFPSGVIALGVLVMTRSPERAMRLWMLLGSLLAIFLALGFFTLSGSLTV